MAATEPNGDFIMFRNILDKLERSVDVLGNHYFCRRCTGHDTLVMQDGVIYTTELHREYDVNTSESNAMEELERLTMMKTKIATLAFPSPYRNKVVQRSLLDKTIDSKIDFIKGGSYGRLVIGGGVEPIVALERLTEVQKKFGSPRMYDLLVAKIKEVVYTATPKASPRGIMSSGHKLHLYIAACYQIYHYGLLSQRRCSFQLCKLKISAP